MSRLLIVLSIIAAVISFIAYVVDDGLSNEPIYWILLAMFLYGIRSVQVEFQRRA